MELIMIFVRPYVGLWEAGFLAIIFTGLSFVQMYRGLPVWQRLWQKWEAWQSGPLTAKRKGVAEEASFYVAVPIGVFLHELGHALAVVAFGGRVLEFGFFFFWGYVLPQGEFTAVEHWIIASAGTWGNLLFALAVWLAWRHRPSSFVQYLMLRTIRFQIFFALIYYPIFTLLLQIGDWRTIYDFAATPWLSGITAVSHLLILAIHIWADRQGWYEMPSSQTEAEAEQLDVLLRQAELEPHNLPRQRQIIHILINGEADRQVARRLKKLLADNPNWAEGYLVRAISRVQRQDNVSATIRGDAQKALQLGLDAPLDRYVAHELCGQYLLHTEKYAEAEQQFTSALWEVATMPERTDLRARQHYQLAEVYRRQQNYSAAAAEMQNALVWADADTAVFYRNHFIQTIQPYL
jgi:tetratricopeptide (TPR) repeat protein